MSEHDSSLSESELRLAAMNWLARREHSDFELREKLRKRFGSEVDTLAGPVLERLKEQGLQSDERFAEAYATAKERQGKGPLRIAQELRQKGVSDSLVDACLDESDERWWSLAADVRAKRFGDKPIASPREKARQMRFLQYRGFSHEQISRAIASAPRHP